MRVMNTDAKSHLAKTPEKCLKEAERVKKKMYLETCLQQCRHFSHFFASFDGQMGVKATYTLKIIASCLATKWWQTYSRTMVRATQRCIRWYRVPAHKISVQRPQW